ncbi:O-antigen ligase family protein [Winogradskyella litoriviva]|uniref:O-antigen ligase family protein n=1 Tax=Winogradskyella litoriviva TaxID=1220182 RepID=A0ABX2E1H4_9FLAO|nr:O-antigen ligase family protein [Winogradskyella litoriviva]NRD22155.1 O-antigen ligase family protein [Winogradskyella litoriviva]
MKNFSPISQIKIKHHFLFLLMAIVVCYYVFNQYYLLSNPIKSIELVFSDKVTKEEIPIVYISSNKESEISFTKVYRFHNTENLVYQSLLDDKKKLRKLRLYFPHPNKTVGIKSIRLKSGNDEISILLKKFKKSAGIKFIERPNELKLETHIVNGYFELPETYIYKSDFINIYQLVLSFFVLWVLIIIVLKILNPIEFEVFCIGNLSMILFLLSIFLPAPIYNITLIIIAVLNIKNISWIAIKSQKTNILILGLFTIYLLNNLFVSGESFNELSTIERFLPLIILGIVLPGISNRKFLSLFPYSALCIGFWLLSTSVFDVYIHQNFKFLSFDFFTKYLHPVYFSYLLFFSICFIDLNYKGKHKYILEFILFMFLIFCGSKMVFLFSLMVITINFIKNIKVLFLIFPILIVVFMFSPIKNRFNEVLKIDDFTILNEKHIENPYDTRINGLTLRLILWRETLETMRFKDFFFGKGVSKETNHLLNARLEKLGLKEHIGFNPHNQYVDTFWRTGFLGFFVLIAIPLYSFVLGLRNKDKLLIQFSLFMIAVMFSESIFGRVNGIYFFTTVMLILINSSQLHENRNIRN